jgi:hypothetical protein
MNFTQIVKSVYNSPPCPYRCSEDGHCSEVGPKY